ncbi:MAG: HAD family phosphatase [Lachnospiraceae bacterium]|nr:HAD family phosphatase [Lachnospiraceae bacterium]
MVKERAIVCFDLDGTLLDNHKNRIPDSSLKAVRELKTAGHVVVISTGRDMETGYSLEYCRTVSPDAVIHQNGSKITAGERLLFRHTMSRSLLRDIYEFGKSRGYCFGTTIGNEDFFIDPEKRIRADGIHYKNVKRNFRPFEELFTRELEVTGLSLTGDISAEKAEIEAAFPGLEVLPFSGNVSADVVERGFSKAEGLKYLCGYYDIPAERTYAFGDSSNDAAILRWAAVGIAMGNADAAAIEAADYVTDDLEHDGIYNACVRFGLIGAYTV